MTSPSPSGQAYLKAFVKRSLDEGVARELAAIAHGCRSDGNHATADGMLAVVRHHRMESDGGARLGRGAEGSPCPHPSRLHIAPGSLKATGPHQARRAPLGLAGADLVQGDRGRPPPIEGAAALPVEHPGLTYVVADKPGVSEACGAADWAPPA